MLQILPWLFVIPPLLVVLTVLASILYSRTRGGRARRHLADGGRATANKNPSRAEEEFRRGLSLRPNHVGLLASLGSLLEAQGRYEDALPLLRKAQAADPGDAGLGLLEARCVAEIEERAGAAAAEEPITDGLVS